jgi:hypothetical protein
VKGGVPRIETDGKNMMAQCVGMSLHV